MYPVSFSKIGLRCDLTRGVRKIRFWRADPYASNVLSVNYLAREFRAGILCALGARFKTECVRVDVGVVGRAILAPRVMRLFKVRTPLYVGEFVKLPACFVAMCVHFGSVNVFFVFV